jgi:hypothetical protein
MCTRASASASSRSSFARKDATGKGGRTAKTEGIRRRLEASRAEARKNVKADLEGIAMRELDFAADTLRAIDEAAREAVAEFPIFKKVAEGDADEHRLG